jgi:hypothetical protein
MARTGRRWKQLYEESRFAKVIIALTVLVILIGIALNFVSKSRWQSSGQLAGVNEIGERRQLSASVRSWAGEVSTSDEIKK